MSVTVTETPTAVLGGARANRAHGLTPAAVRDACGPRVYVAPLDGRLWAVGMYWAAPVQILDRAARYFPDGITPLAGCYLASGRGFVRADARALPDPEALLVDALTRATDVLMASDHCVGTLPAVVLTDATGTERYAASVRYLDLLAGRGPRGRGRDGHGTSGAEAIRTGHVQVTGAEAPRPLVLRQRRAWADDSPCDHLLGVLMPVHLGQRR